MARIKIKEILTERNMSMYKLSEITGIRYQTVHDWYHSKRQSISFKHISMLMKALDLNSIDELIEYDDSVKLGA